MSEKGVGIGLLVMVNNFIDMTKLFNLFAIFDVISEHVYEWMKLQHSQMFYNNLCLY